MKPKLTKFITLFLLVTFLFQASFVQGIVEPGELPQPPIEGPPYFSLETTFIDLGADRNSGSYKIFAHSSVKWQTESLAIDQKILTLSKTSGQGPAEISFSINKSKLKSGWQDLWVNYNWQATYQGTEIQGSDSLTIGVYVAAPHPPVTTEEPAPESTPSPVPEEITPTPEPTPPPASEEKGVLSPGLVVAIILLSLSLVAGVIYILKGLCGWIIEKFFKAEKKKTCPTCNGSGSIEVEKKVPIECETCKGREKSTGFQRCPHCGGTGKCAATASAMSATGPLTDAEYECLPPCNYCRGSGVKDDAILKRAIPGALDFASCSKCEGGGWYTGDKKVKETCPTCKGSGFIME